VHLLPCAAATVSDNSVDDNVMEIVLQ